ncbi:MAG: 2OG-Fe(II) oxygenase [Chitinophagales bacterium]
MPENFIAPEFADLQKTAEKYKNTYQNNPPFPSFYLDNFFKPDFLRSVLSEFPDNEKKLGIHYQNPNEAKYASSGESAFGTNTKQLLHYLNSEPFLQFVQELTGIKETLIPDPYFIGGGFHEIKKGGFLKLHVDFHKHKTMNLDRRVNLLIYLNEDWKDEYGGHFELWEKDMSKAVVRIAPLFNRIAMFSTTGYSWHGHPDPLTCPDDRSRKSIALYYYTNGRPDNEISKDQRNRITTEFAGRKGLDSNKMKTYNTTVNFLNRVLPGSVVRFIKKFRNT